MCERKVVIGIDNSECCEAAFDWFVKNIYREGDKVCCVHCAQFPHGPLAGAIISGEHQQRVKETEKGIEELEQKFAGKCKEKEFKGAKIKVVGGEPGHQIVEAAKNEGASMIVVGTRGQGLIRRTVLGSVSSYVLHHSECPVVVAQLSK